MAEATIAELQREQRRTRERLHDIEPMVKVLGTIVNTLVGQMTVVARDAAREAVRLAFEERDERHERGWTRTEKVIGLAIAITLAVLNIMGFFVHG